MTVSVSGDVNATGVELSARTALASALASAFCLCLSSV